MNPLESEDVSIGTRIKISIAYYVLSVILSKSTTFLSERKNTRSLCRGSKNCYKASTFDLLTSQIRICLIASYSVELSNSSTNPGISTLKFVSFADIIVKTKAVLEGIRLYIYK